MPIIQPLKTVSEMQKIRLAPDVLAHLACLNSSVYLDPSPDTLSLYVTFMPTSSSTAVIASIISGLCRVCRGIY